MKKGFTLTELIAVIVLIGLIGLISIIPINKMLKDAKDELYNKQIEQIILATQNWGTDNQVLLVQKQEEMNDTIEQLELNDENDIREYYSVNPIVTKTVDELIADDYLEKNIKDLKDEKNIILGCSRVEIYFNYDSISTAKKTYKYKFVRLEVC